MEKGKFHIVIIPTWMPKPGSTSGIFAREQADALVACGHKVSVLMFQYVSPLNRLKLRLKGLPASNWLKGRVVTPIALDFVNPIPTRFSPDPNKKQKTAFLKFAEKKFAQYIKLNGKPDLIHHHEIADFCYITAYLSEKFGIPYVITEHSPRHPDDIHFNAYETKEERIEMIRHAKMRMAVSNFYKRKYEGLFDTPFITVPNLVNRIFTETPLPSLPKVNQDFRFLNVGATVPIKRQDILIKAFTKAFKNMPGIRLTIVGSGVSENELRNLISSLGMENRVDMPGSKNKMDILALMDAVNITVVSSETETFSVVAAESLSRGNPVLTTRCGGPEEFVDDNNGVVCLVNDEHDMAEKMQLIYDKYNSFDHQAIARKASEMFSEQAVVKQLEEIYTKAIA
jgi:glycosyltransferase involved in cell wall biosynthesis